MYLHMEWSVVNMFLSFQIYVAKVLMTTEAL